MSERNAAALSRAAAGGATVVLVTGRPHRRVAALARSLPCHPLVLCANGALVYDATADRVVDAHPIDPATAAEVVARLRAALPGAVFAVEHPDGFGHEPGYPLSFELPANTMVALAEELVTVGPTKLLARGPGPAGAAERAATWKDADLLYAVAREAVGELAELSMSARDGLVEVAARGVTKAFALARLAEDLGIDAGEVVAFGDMLNDVPMLEWAGLGVAMGNAHEAVRRAADEVTSAFDEDGVAVVLERLFPPVGPGGPAPGACPPRPAAGRPVSDGRAGGPRARLPGTA